MNKNAILASLLTLGMISNAFGFNEEQRGILYTLHELGQDFASVPMIFENIDMFTGVIEMNIQINEKKLQVATSKRNKALIKNIAIVVGVALGRGFANIYLLDALRSQLSCVIDYGLFGIVSLANINSGLAIYDAFKAKSTLEESLALDKEILAKLQEIRDSLAQDAPEADVDTASTGKDLLKNLA